MQVDSNAKARFLERIVLTRLIIFTAEHHVITLGKHLDHSRFTCAAMPVNKIHVFQVMFNNVVAYRYFHNHALRINVLFIYSLLL